MSDSPMWNGSIHSARFHNSFRLLFLNLGKYIIGVGEDDSRRPGGPRSQQQQQQMNQNLHSELALSKEQLYDLFQQILGVKKFEHQLLFNALQVNRRPQCLFYTKQM